LNGAATDKGNYAIYSCKILPDKAVNIKAPGQKNFGGYSKKDSWYRTRRVWVVKQGLQKKKPTKGGILPANQRLEIRMNCAVDYRKKRGGGGK